VPGSTSVARAAAAARALTPPPLARPGPAAAPQLQRAPGALSAAEAEQDPGCRRLAQLAADAAALSDASYLALPRGLALPAAGPVSSQHADASLAQLQALPGTNMKLLQQAGSCDWQLRLLENAAAAAGVGAQAPAQPCSCRLGALQAPASRWLASLTLRGEEGSCLEAVVEGLEELTAAHSAPPRLLPTHELALAQEVGEALAAAAAGAAQARAAAEAAAQAPAAAAAAAAAAPAACGAERDWTPHPGPQPQALQRAAAALCAAAPRAAAQGAQAAADRLCALRMMAIGEVRRQQAEQQRLVGRVRRMPAFDHYMDRRLPTLGSQPGLMASLVVGGRALALEGAGG
jgi:hypothetical protein